MIKTLKSLRSQTLSCASSPPLTKNGSFRFQLITLTSVKWASAAVSILALRGEARTSQIRMDLSAEHEANTLGSLGDHWMSSTEPVWPASGRWSTCQLDWLPSSRRHTWMFLWQSPVANWPATCGDQSIAKPSVWWPANWNTGLTVSFFTNSAIDLVSVTALSAFVRSQMFTLPSSDQLAARCRPFIRDAFEIIIH